MADQKGLVHVFANLKEQIALLAFSGIGGAFFRAFLALEEQWRRRVVPGNSGILPSVSVPGMIGGWYGWVTNQSGQALCVGGCVAACGVLE